MIKNKNTSYKKRTIASGLRVLHEGLWLQQGQLCLLLFVPVMDRRRNCLVVVLGDGIKSASFSCHNLVSIVPLRLSLWSYIDKQTHLKPIPAVSSAGHTPYIGSASEGDR